MKRPEPKNVEAQLNIDEMFFSKTDLKGIILDGNEVFYRVSKYTRDEMVGKPHNIVRHPDMPKVVFKLLWEFIKNDKPFAGYVKNLAKDGSYYWVFAVVVPIFEGGKKEKYLSIRIKPTSNLFAVIRNLYQKLLQIEKEEGVEASEKELIESLKAMGYPSYEAFMREALIEELKDKDKYLDVQIDLNKIPSEFSFIREIYNLSKKAKNIFDLVYAKARDFVNLEKELENKFSYVFEITDELSLIALNSSVESYKLGSAGASFFVVSTEIKKDSERIGKLVSGLRSDIATLLNIVRDLELYVNISKLEIYMINYFINELIGNLEKDDEMHRDMENLLDLVLALENNSKKIIEYSKQLHNYLAKAMRYIEQIEEIISELHYIQLNGLIESARLGEQKFSIIFNQVKELVENTNKLIEDVNPMIKKGINDSDEMREANEKIMKEMKKITKILKKEDKNLKAGASR